MARDTALASLNEKGYTLIRGVLSRSQALLLGDLAEQRWQRRANVNGHFLHEFDFLNLEPRFRALVDLRPVLAIVTAALGYNIYVYHCHLTVTHRCTGTDGRLLAAPFEWHQDGGPLIADLGGPGAPRMSVKAGFLLSDVPTSQYGPTVMLANSHRGQSRVPAERDREWPGATPITGQAGDCVVFDNRIWHSRSPNLTDRPRVLASVAYAPRWIRSRDRLTPPDLTGIDPASALAQLLGHAHDARSCHVPTADTQSALLHYLMR